jgi:glycosyltransferase involved in cell wall biosynthesis
MGIPVIGTDVGGPVEILRPGYDGVALPPDDIEAWAAAAAELSLRGRLLGSRAYALERFNPERHAEAIMSVYDRVRANGAAGMKANSALDRVRFP